MSEPGAEQWVVFWLDEQRYALRLREVEQVVRAVEISPLPRAPEVVRGVIDLRGRITPVVDLRRRFGRASRELRIEDHFIVVRTRDHQVALVVDAVMGVTGIAAEAIASASTVLPEMPYVAGVAKLADGMVFVHDLEAFLSLAEARALGEAMAAREAAP